MDSDSIKTALSVNVNKIAVLRNSRGGDEPSVLHAARTCLEAGANGITVHPRPDRRHVTAEDVLALAPLTKQFEVELNIEGNPFAPARRGYPGLLALCEQARPAQVTLVPDSDGQLTSDHGFDFSQENTELAKLAAAFTRLGCRVSLFVDARCRGLEHAAAMGADRIELYTGPYAEAWAAHAPEQALAACRETALEAQQLGMEVNAGHDLSQNNLAHFLQNIPNVREVSIGHALIGEALYEGLETTVKRYLELIARVNKK